MQKFSKILQFLKRLLPILENALGKLWELVEPKLTPEDLEKLGVTVNKSENEINNVFDELWLFGPRGPAGIGLGRYGGHAV